MKKDFNAFIFARGGSKGVKNKNLRKVNGLSLVRRSIDLALQLNNVSRIFLSTDSENIANEAKSLNIQIIKRPAYLSDDKAPEISAWKHAINVVESKFGKFDKFVSLPPTSPLRKLDDVKRIMSLLDDGFDLTLGITKSKRNPWFNMVQISKSNNLKKIFRNQEFTRRQDAPEIFDITTIAYASNTNYIMATENILDGSIGGVQIPEERSLDIDNLFDLELAEFLIKKNL